MSQVIADVITDEALDQLYVGVRPQPGVVGLGYWVVPDARGRGFATRAASLVSTWLLTLDGVARVEACSGPSEHRLRVDQIPPQRRRRCSLRSASGPASNAELDATSLQPQLASSARSSQPSCSRCMPL